MTALTSDTRVLARLVLQLLRIDAPLAPPVPAAISDLAEAVRALAHELETDGRPDRAESDRRGHAVRCASRDPTYPGSSGDLIAREIRSFALHILYARGIEVRTARATLEEEAER